MSEHPSRIPNDDARPVVPLPSGGPPVVVILAGCLVLGLALFGFLEGRRKLATHTQVYPVQAGASEISAPAPPLEIPAPPPPPPPAAPVIRYVDRPAPARPVIQYVDRPASAVSPEPPRPTRSPEPALVIDLTQPDLGEKAEDTAARATVLRHRSTIVPQGTIIPAVLETPVDTTGPGPARAITSTDIRGFDGARVLIPRGSRLYGEYRSDAQIGQARVFVTWTNLVRPDGISIHLNSPGADARGGPGVPGRVNSHVLARLGSATLQSALAVGVNLASRPGNGSVIINAPIQTLGQAGQALLPAADAKPSITVKAGADITVFVARDLDFTGALPRQ
jgi:type IV secretion system protein VirB10